MRRIKLVLAIVGVMVAMLAVYAMPAVADNNNRNFFRFDGNGNNDGFRVVRNNINDFNDLLDLGCLGAVIDFRCFGIPIFDGIFFLDNNNGDFNNNNDGVFFGG